MFEESPNETLFFVLFDDGIVVVMGRLFLLFGFLFVIGCDSIAKAVQQMKEQ